MMINSFPAHIRLSQDGIRVQPVCDHANNTADRCESILNGIGLSKTGKLVGLLHDMGKFTEEFSEYIQKAAKGESVHRGSVNHTFAGVRWIWTNFHREKAENVSDAWINMTCELTALAVGAHHGQFDCIDPDGRDGFRHRLTEKIAYDEAVANFYELCVSKQDLDDLFRCSVGEIERVFSYNNRKNQNVFSFSMLYRLVLSALIEADRSDTALFMSDIDTSDFEASDSLWEKLLYNLENKIEKFSWEKDVDRARRIISDRAVLFGDMPCGIYRLSVPTGGGKTLSSLRAALSHAKKQKKRRIIFTVPLLTVLEQNAEVIREVINDDSLILEHHSNVIREQTDGNELNQNELITENWHSPIIITTLVQLLNTLFDGKPSCIRRMHALIDSVVIIDEVQTVPGKMLSMFNEAVNFLADVCHCTVILCSATQPCFEKAVHPMYGADDIIPYDGELWKAFKRTELVDLTESVMDADALAAFTLEKLSESDSVLVICNKKSEARQLFDRLKNSSASVFHLSASMCMKHRIDVINRITSEKNSPLICVSTQIMEAGVDLSFGCVIRVLAGLDNHIQAAGRCNRNGECNRICPVYCVAWANERLSGLPDIENSQKSMVKLLYKFRNNPEEFGDLQSEQAVRYYYENLYKSEKDKKQEYYVKRYSSSVYDMLTENSQFKGKCRNCLPMVYRQAFKTAGEEFTVFDQATTDILVGWGDGEKLICEFASEKALNNLSYRRELLKRSKLYSVSVYDYEIKKLTEEHALSTVCGGSVSVLDSSFYDEHTGVVTEKILKFQEI